MELGCVWMSLQRDCMILGVFIKIFGAEIVIGLSNHCDLILTVTFDLSKNCRYMSDISDILPIYL